MKKNLLITAFVVFVSALLANPLFAQIEKVILRVDGLACPFCTYGLEKKISKIEGVTKYEVSLPDAKAFIDLDPEAQVDLDKFRNAVKEAGFTLSGIFLRVKGTLTKTEVGYVLTVGGIDEELLLFEDTAMIKKYHQGADPQDLALSKELNEKFAQILREKTEVRIEGRVHEHGGLPAGLSVDKLEVA